jgi:hypothetical protein
MPKGDAVVWRYMVNKPCIWSQEETHPNLCATLRYTRMKHVEQKAIDHLECCRWELGRNISMQLQTSQPVLVFVSPEPSDL